MTARISFVMLGSASWAARDRVGGCGVSVDLVWAVVEAWHRALLGHSSTSVVFYVRSTEAVGWTSPYVGLIALRMDLRCSPYLRLLRCSQQVSRCAA